MIKLTHVCHGFYRWTGALPKIKGLSSNEIKKLKRFQPNQNLVGIRKGRLYTDGKLCDRPYFGCRCVASKPDGYIEILERDLHLIIFNKEIVEPLFIMGGVAWGNGVDRILLSMDDILPCVSFKGSTLSGDPSIILEAIKSNEISGDARFTYDGEVLVELKNPVTEEFLKRVGYHSLTGKPTSNDFVPLKIVPNNAEHLLPVHTRDEAFEEYGLSKIEVRLSTKNGIELLKAVIFDPLKAAKWKSWFGNFDPGTIVYFHENFYRGLTIPLSMVDCFDFHGVQDFYYSQGRVMGKSNLRLKPNQILPILGDNLIIADKNYLNSSLLPVTKYRQQVIQQAALINVKAPNTHNVYCDESLPYKYVLQSDWDAFQTQLAERREQIKNDIGTLPANWINLSDEEISQHRNAVEKRKQGWVPISGWQTFLAWLARETELCVYDPIEKHFLAQKQEPEVWVSHPKFPSFLEGQLPDESRELFFTAFTSEHFRSSILQHLLSGGAAEESS